MISLPERGYTRRIRIYFSEMFPIPARIVGASLLFVSFTLSLARIHGTEATVFSLKTVIGSLGVFMIMLILRLMDELKDMETDLELFSHRPLPSGRVKERDITFSLAGAVFFYLAVNLLSPETLWVALVALAYTFLMFRYFFIPRILKRYLLLNLATHNPIIPIMLFYILALYKAEQGLGLRDLSWNYILVLVLMYWAMFFAWEISRKIRTAEEEDAYVTYSKILGPAGAVGVAAGAQTVTMAAGLFFFSTMPMSVLFLLIMLAGYFITMSGYLRFITRPNRTTSDPGPFAERYIVIVIAASIVGHAMTM